MVTWASWGFGDVGVGNLASLLYDTCPPQPSTPPVLGERDQRVPQTPEAPPKESEAAKNDSDDDAWGKQWQGDGTKHDLDDEVGVADCDAETIPGDLS